MEWDEPTASSTKDMEFRAEPQRHHKRSRWYARLFDAIILILAGLTFVATVWNFDDIMTWVYAYQ